MRFHLQFEWFNKVTSGCTPPTIPSCSITTDNPALLESSTLISLSPSTPVGQFAGTLKCTEGNFETTESFSFTIVNPTDLRYVEQPIKIFSDCGRTKLTATDLQFTDDGGVDGSMIQITYNPSFYGDQFYLDFNRTWMAADTFTQQDINDGLVYFTPKPSTYVDSSRDLQFAFRALDPAGQQVEPTVNYTVQYQFCPIAMQNSVYLITSTSQPVIIGNQVFGLTEVHGLSVWEVSWILPVLPVGRWEYYCPDKLCAGPGWKVAIANTEIKYVFMPY